MINKKYHLIFSLYFLAFGILIALIVSFINYQSNFINMENKIHNMADGEIADKRAYLRQYIQQTQMLLDSIVKSDFTIKYIQSKSKINQKNLNNLFYALAKSNKDIMQLRYINSSGKELIRIDRDKTSTNLKIVRDDKLQEKKNRYYFEETSLLSGNQFWHSNIDLNIENGRIERPLKPTFRVAKKLVVDGKFQGIIIANFLFKDSLEILSKSLIFNVLLIDNDGEIIHAPNNKNLWSKYLEEESSFGKMFPKNSKNILKNKNFNTDKLYSFYLGDIFNNNENLKIIFRTKRTAINIIKKENTFTALIIALTVIIVAFPLSWIISIIPSNLQKKLSESYEKIKKDSQIIDQYVMISKTNKNGITTDVSKKFTAITGYSYDDIVGKNHTILSHPDTPNQVYKDLWKTIQNGNVWENEIKDLSKSGEEFWVYIIISPEFNKKNEIQGYTAIAQDITDKKTIEQLSKTDFLTKLYNREEIQRVLEIEINRTNRYNTNFSILFIDIDKFKTINDTFGHNVGDDVLVELSKILKDNSRKTDTIGRWGGEEFIIVCTQTDIKEAFDFADHLRKIIENHKFPTVKQVTISCGVAQYEKDDTSSKIISKADAALYIAKEEGRNRVIEG